VSREIGLASVELAPFAGVHNLAGVSDRSGPVEALVERVAHEGAWRRVVTTHARVDVAEELTPLGDGYVLTVNSCIKVRLDLQADKSPVVVKGPFFP
jgi:hypothetical protein